MFFDVFGPYPIAKSNHAISKTQIKFWDEVAKSDALDSAIGCYLFALRHGENIKPWYVGMTVARSGFRGEIFQSHKQEIYNCILEKKKGMPIMFLFPMVVSIDPYKFSRAHQSGKKLVLWVEKMLIGLAYGQNPDLANQRDTKFLRSCVVHGILGHPVPGRPYREVTAARRALLSRVTLPKVVV